MDNFQYVLIIGVPILAFAFGAIGGGIAGRKLWQMLLLLSAVHYLFKSSGKIYKVPLEKYSFAQWSFISLGLWSVFVLWTPLLTLYIAGSPRVVFELLANKNPSLGWSYIGVLILFGFMWGNDCRAKMSAGRT